MLLSGFHAALEVKLSDKQKAPHAALFVAHSDDAYLTAATM
jgi:hypothetical protein